MRGPQGLPVLAAAAPRAQQAAAAACQQAAGSRRPAAGACQRAAKAAGPSLRRAGRRPAAPLLACKASQQQHRQTVPLCASQRSHAAKWSKFCRHRRIGVLRRAFFARGSTAILSPVSAAQSTLRERVHHKQQLEGVASSWRGHWSLCLLQPPARLLGARTHPPRNTNTRVLHEYSRVTYPWRRMLRYKSLISVRVISSQRTCRHALGPCSGPGRSTPARAVAIAAAASACSAAHTYTHARMPHARPARIKAS